VGETYESLSISEDKNKTAQATLKLLVDPTFIFWATHMRLIYTLVYKSAFSAVQANHHHAAPELAGPDGLPVRWAATFRSAVIKPARGSGKVSLSETVCAPLVALLRRHPSLGGLQGEVAAAVAADFEAQAAHVESYFSKWNTLEALAHALARELTIKGPLSEAVHRRAAELNLKFEELQQRIPAPQALAAATLGMRLFAEATEEVRSALPGTLSWLLFSPKTRDGAVNPVYIEVQAFASASINPVTGLAFPYRCWHELTQVIVAGGAKYCPSTSAQLESEFNGLTRQQGASKLHISQPQIAFESRCGKNDTMASLTESMLRFGWADAKVSCLPPLAPTLAPACLPTDTFPGACPRPGGQGSSGRPGLLVVRHHGRRQSEALPEAQGGRRDRGCGGRGAGAGGDVGGREDPELEQGSEDGRALLHREVEGLGEQAQHGRARGPPALLQAAAGLLEEEKEQEGAGARDQAAGGGASREAGR